MEMETGLASCVTCRVSFAMGEQQREHHKSDWHRYNLKRRMAELAPVPHAAFAAKVAAAAVVEAPALDLRCAPCRKNFRSHPALLNHNDSKRHKDLAAHAVAGPPALDAPAPADVAEDAGDSSDSEWSESDESVGLEECLFCEEVADDLDAAMAHMGRAHGFFLPEAEFCVDVEGLKLYLGRKVGEGHMCLWCNERGKRFPCLDAARKHMRDKGHCRLAHDDEAWAEYGDFFDFSPSYPDAAEAEATAPAELPELEERDWQLVLPSGATLGHRALRLYFRQRALPENSSLVLSGTARRRGPSQKLLSTYRALGWTGTAGVAAQRQAKDQAFLRKLRQKARLHQGINGNKNLQHHFRHRDG